MDKPKEDFRDHLLGMETASPGLKEKYEKEKQAMLEKKVTGWTKFGCVGGLLMGLFFFVFFGFVAITASPALPLWARSGFILGSLFGLLIIVFNGWQLKRGTIDLKTDEVAGAGLGWAFVVIIGTITLVFSDRLDDPIIAVKMLVSLLFYLVGAGAMLSKAFIERSELNTREKLLEIEHQLAELAEKVDRMGSKP